MHSHSEDPIKYIYDAWHRTVTARDAKALAELYAPDAIFESPAVLVTTGSGILRGRDAVRDYFDQFFAQVGAGIKEWYRDGRYYSNGTTLVWEYPRVTPFGEQADIVEFMDTDEQGLITHHRVYWGFYGFKNNLSSPQK